MNSFPQHFRFLFFCLITLKKLEEMVKVTVCCAAGGIGQPLALLLKQSPYVSHLSLYDIVNTPGVAADLRYVILVLSWTKILIHLLAISTQNPRWPDTLVPLNLKKPSRTLMSVSCHNIRTHMCESAYTESIFYQLSFLLVFLESQVWRVMIFSRSTLVLFVIWLLLLPSLLPRHSCALSLTLSTLPFLLLLRYSSNTMSMILAGKP